MSQLFDLFAASYFLRSKRRLVYLFLDLFLCAGSLWLAYLLRFDGHLPARHEEDFFKILPIVLIVRSLFFTFLGLYKPLWQYFSIDELLSVCKAVGLSSVVIPCLLFIVHFPLPPRSVFIVDFVLLVGLISITRLGLRSFRRRTLRPSLNTLPRKILVVGINAVTEALIRESAICGYRVAGIIDVDAKRKGARIYSVPIVGGVEDVLAQAINLECKEVYICESSLRSVNLSELVRRTKENGIECKIYKGALFEREPVRVKERFRPIEISDLLGRELAAIEKKALSQFYACRRVVVTGAGGSIGSELVRVLCGCGAAHVALVDNCEANLYEMECELKARGWWERTSLFLRDVTRPYEMESVFREVKPDVVFHAAAYKQVPLVEHHVREGVWNNVVGTKVVADTALKFSVERFVLISSDKAIRPSSVMGATKRVAELYVQELASSGVKFLSVRFGNVFNSKGSVVPLFKKQIQESYSVTITHPEVTRYFMDVTEAVALVLQAATLGKGGEVFVLDMGKPLRIQELAYNLAELMGVSREKLGVEYIGLRPGEKLHEEIEWACETLQPTTQPKLKIWRAENASSLSLDDELAKLKSMASDGASRADLIALLKKIVPEYIPSSESQVEGE